MNKMNEYVVELIDGIRKEIDMTPINDIFRRWDDAVEREDIKDRRVVEVCREMHELYLELDCEQREYFFGRLVGEMSKYADLFQSVLDNPARVVENNNFLREVRKSVGENYLGSREKDEGLEG